ncbi:MAG: hypothetical protein IKG40_00375 [Bacilli bacterium]|nr:hypothetical protein [Bacilli bacterium]
MKKIDRRTFIKLISISALGLISQGCSTMRKQTMKPSELYDFNVVIYDNEAKYVIYDGYGNFLALGLDKEYLTIHNLYDISKDEKANPKKEVYENFENAFNITFKEPALFTLEENIGEKDEYSISDLQNNLNIIKENLKEKNKVLSK